jgi:hypothetical protein
MEVAMQCFIRERNIALYKMLIAASERDPSRDEERHRMLVTLLADEMAGTASRRTVSRLPSYLPKR